MAILSTSEVKNFLQIAHSEQDVTIATLISAVVEWAARELGLVISDSAGASVIEYLSASPGGSQYLYPTAKPIKSIASISNVVTGDSYSDLFFDKCRVWKRYGALWAYCQDGEYKVTLVGGYTGSTLPAGLKHSLLDLVARAYRARGGVASESAAGFSRSWAELAGSDLMARLHVYSLGSQIF
jgi:hypothetical protein